MTTPTQGEHAQTAPQVQRYKIGYASDSWGERSSTPSGIPDHAGAWVRYEDHAAQVAALTAQPAAPQGVAYAEPTPDELRAIAREARNSSGSASDDCGAAVYVLYGWRAAMSKSPSIDDLCARIKAADDAAADSDYMLDSNDCIAVLRGQWKGPMAMDKPELASNGQAPAAENELWRERLLNEDIAWLEMFAPNTAVRSHIIDVLRGAMDGQAPAGAAEETESRCANCGKPASESQERIADYPEEGEWFCSVQCKDQHEELDCPHLTHGGYRHPAESERLIACEAALRSLAYWLGVGGYNSDSVDAKVFEEKIRWGVEHLLQSSPTAQAAPALAENGRLTQAGHDLLMEATLDGTTLVSKGRLVGDMEQAVLDAGAVAGPGWVSVPVEVLNLYHFMASAFVPFTGQHQEIDISLQLAKKAMLAAAPTPAAQADSATDGMTIVKALRRGLRAEPWIPDGPGKTACVGICAIQLQGWTHTAETAWAWADAYNRGADHMREALAADSVLEDAARWNEVLMHVGAANHLGGQHFTLNTLRIRDQMFLLRGSVAQHFTACIDDSRAARKQGAKHD